VLTALLCTTVGGCHLLRQLAAHLKLCAFAEHLSQLLGMSSNVCANGLGWVLQMAPALHCHRVANHSLEIMFHLLPSAVLWPALTSETMSGTSSGHDHLANMFPFGRSKFNHNHDHAVLTPLQLRVTLASCTA